jgi:sugar phosphate isomerase/epimerase
MKYGVCGDPKMAFIAKEAGYDYFEWSIGDYLHPRESEAVFEAALKQVRATGLPCPAANVFIPGDLKITGPEVNLDKLAAFASTALCRAETAEVETIVFGSGGARRIPDGFDREKAWEQLVRFGKMLGPIAAKHRVTIAVEPLNRGECNIMNTVGECGFLVREVNHPNIRLLVDGYHWAKDSDTLSGILENASLIVHAHIATVEGRLPPNPADPCSAFFSAMGQAGYSGRVSIEGMITNAAEELPRALAIMRKESS